MNRTKSLDSARAWASERAKQFASDGWVGFGAGKGETQGVVEVRGGQGGSSGKGEEGLLIETLPESPDGGKRRRASSLPLPSQSFHSGQVWHHPPVPLAE